MPILNTAKNSMFRIITSNVLNMVISIIIGAIVYFILLLIQKTLTKQEQKSIPILNKVFSRF